MIPWIRPITKDPNKPLTEEEVKEIQRRRMINTKDNQQQNSAQ